MQLALAIPMVITLNPFDWSTGTYLVLIALVLLASQVVPGGTRWYTRLGREMLIIAPAVFLYFAVRGIVSARDEDAYNNAETVIRIQERLGIFHEPGLQAWIVSSDFLTRTMNWIYIWGHWPVVVGTLVWLIVRRPKTYRIYRNAFLISGIIAMFVFATFPVAPPRLMPDLAVVDTVTEQSNSYRVLQPPALTNPYAAMPSLHFGWNLLMGIAIVREARRREFQVFGYVMPVLMYLGIILTANHYFLDGLVGGALVLGSVWLSMTLLRARGDLQYPEDDDALSDELPDRQDLAPAPGVMALSMANHPLRRLPAPVTIAHRAGNSLERVRAAARDGIDVVEADVWLHRDRLEVRHSKTLGPIPARWDRWWIRFRPEPCLELPELLRSLPGGTLLMLDLKGRNPDLPARLAEAVQQDLPDTDVLVCSQNWGMLEQLRGVPGISLVHSIGNRRQLAMAWHTLEGDGYDAVSIHAQLLNVHTARKLLERVPVVITWPINTREEFERVSSLGVTGVTSDSPELLGEIAGATARCEKGQFVAAR